MRESEVIVPTHEPRYVERLLMEVLLSERCPPELVDLSWMLAGSRAPAARLPHRTKSYIRYVWRRIYAGAPPNRAHDVYFEEFLQRRRL